MVVRACKARLGDASVLRPDAWVFLLEDWLAHGPRNNVDAFDQTDGHVLFAQNLLAAPSNGRAPYRKDPL